MFRSPLMSEATGSIRRIKTLNFGGRFGFREDSHGRASESRHSVRGRGMTDRDDDGSLARYRPGPSRTGGTSRLSASRGRDRTRVRPETCTAQTRSGALPVDCLRRTPCIGGVRLTD